MAGGCSTSRISFIPVSTVAMHKPVPVPQDMFHGRVQDMFHELVYKNFNLVILSDFRNLDVTYFNVKNKPQNRGVKN